MSELNNSEVIPKVAQVSINYARITVLSVNLCICLFGMISNSLLLHITRKTSKFPLQHILGIGDLLFCMSYPTASPIRIYWELQGMYNDLVSSIVCFLYPWSHLFSMGYTWSATVTLSIAAERFIASSYPIWYKQNWENRMKKIYIRTVWAVVVLSSTPGFVALTMTATIGNPVKRQGSFTHCTRIIPGFKPIREGYGMSCGILCAVLSTLALVIGKRRRAQLGLAVNDNYLKIQRKMERTVMAIVFCSLVLVTIPSAIRMAEILKILPTQSLKSIELIRRYFIGMIIANSAINFWVYLIFNSEFRKQAKKHILGQTNAVGVTTIGGVSGAVSHNRSKRRLTEKSLGGATH